MELFLASTVVSAVGAIVALLAGRHEGAAKVLGCSFGCVASVLALISGLQGLVGNLATLSVPTVFFDFSLRIDPLGGVLITVISALALAAWIYGFSYFDEYRGKGIGALCFFMNLFIASMNLVVTSDNAFWFLVFFEMMSISSYFLVVIERDAASIKGGFMYLVMAHVGFFLIMVAFFVMAGVTGSFEFESFRQTSFAPVLASLVFVLAFLGFGVKAGMMPFHSWLPQAHPAAPSNVSALMSGGMIKIGIFGILKVAFDLLGASGCQLWWGIMVLLFGAVSAVMGIAYALAESDIKKLLAYCSVENIGIILLGVGTALVGWAASLPALTVLGMLAALFHLISHAMLKGLLFLGAGSVLYATHSRDMGIMGGLGRVMPTTAICFLLGSLAISAIPPLNGFVSEWFTYQGLFTGAMAGDAVVKCACALSVVALAITGALAITCFVKAYGITFLGNSRSDVASQAREVPIPMRGAMVLLAVVCIALGVCAPWITPVLTSAAAATAGAAAIDAASGAMLMNPVLDVAVSTPLVAVLLTASILVPWAIIRAKSKGGTKCTPDPWACGYNPTPDMPLVASSFEGTARMFFQPLYDLRDNLIARSPAFQTFFEKMTDVTDRMQHWGDLAIVEPTSKFVVWLGKVSSKLEGGDYRIYILYVVGTLVLFLALAVAFR